MSTGLPALTAVCINGMYTHAPRSSTVESPADFLADSTGRRQPSGYACSRSRNLSSGTSNSACPNPRHRACDMHASRARFSQKMHTSLVSYRKKY